MDRYVIIHLPFFKVCLDYSSFADLVSFLSKPSIHKFLAQIHHILIEHKFYIIEINQNSFSLKCTFSCELRNEIIVELLQTLNKKLLFLHLVKFFMMTRFWFDMLLKI